MALIQFNLKLQPEVVAQWKEAQENSEALTGNAFVEMLLEAYLNPKTKTIEVNNPDHEKEVLNLNNEIARLKTLIDFKTDEITAAQNLNAEINQQIANLTGQIAELQNLQAAGVQLLPGQEILTIPPVVSLVLDKEAAIAKKQTGKDFSRAEILLNSFWDSVTKGCAYPLKVWSAADLTNLKKQIQPVQ